MKYYNSKTKEYYYGGSITIYDNGSLFSGVPSVEQLQKWGFEEVIDPEPTSEELLENAKQQKIREIIDYDDSLNKFTINLDGSQSITDWITPDIRANYKNSIDSAELLGVEELHPVFNGIQLTIPTQTAKMALAQIQLYADRCYIVTEQHKTAVYQLSTVEDVENYNYTIGYPEKLVFDV